MNALKELYQQTILDHNKNPRNFGELEVCNHCAEGHNPLCGDHIDVFMNIENDIIVDVKFKGAGCAISKASASIMTTILKGKRIEEARRLFESFHDAVTSDPNSTIDEMNLGKLAVFCGVREFPARVKCASLAWHTMINALANEELLMVKA
ncbi:MAG: SUF system NifU family Fe-S cluster assembly protein [Candidatus Kapabacteria bacterium]|nr:SUF system NifU family Fe-S cluster assembly protein [Candidatus Kapabacteria bacterium]